MAFCPSPLTRRSKLADGGAGGDVAIDCEQTQILLFLSPVIYPVTFVTDTLGCPMWVCGLNPMFGVLSGFRWVMGLGPQPSLAIVASSASVTSVVFVSGLWYFRRTEKVFADVI